MPKLPPTVNKIADLRKQVSAWRKTGKTVALVPTMGALHEGHLSLVRLALDNADRTVVSIFVNPSQFAPHEDYDSYPRDEKADAGKLGALGTDLIFAPRADEVYPPGFSTRVEVTGLTDGLCGRSRPHFFGGVATIVAKLLLQCLPDVAIFGEKDYQQLLVIKRLARDLDIPVKILGGPTVRESDGLALSSRNQYLSPADRSTAPLLYQTLSEAALALAGGAEVAHVVETAHGALADAGFAVDYLEVRNARDLSPIAGTVGEPARIFAAASLGETRLIDNLAI